MRPSLQASDRNHWRKAREWWIAAADRYAKLDDRDGFNRCMNRVDLAEWNLLEVDGLVEVYGPEIYKRRATR